jgi:hypothetical protein
VFSLKGFELRLFIKIYSRTFSIGCPKNSTYPLSIGKKPRIALINVVFPEPFDPTIQIIFSEGTLKSISHKTGR